MRCRPVWLSVKIPEKNPNCKKVCKCVGGTDLHSAQQVVRRVIVVVSAAAHERGFVRFLAGHMRNKRHSALLLRTGGG